MNLAETLFTCVALSISGLTLVAVLWSVVRPDCRIWPPQTFGSVEAFVGWAGTLVFFAAVVALGILGWGEIQVPPWLRFVVGPILILVGNVGVWYEVIGFGADQTMGAAGQLKTDGLYRFSRNPQYVSDIAILTGWAILSATVTVLPSVVAGIIVFLAFPFAEEGWLEEQYGAEYLQYKSKVRRFL
ncbi:isoprenylcysteine carboxylmethyltransferase family protein [Pseudorhodobacter sp. W20_MBD10_FR17]|uniref:methyltransferase family protein n=1 Tax=Pseudorhodobacter sp. W20_MBD10_FR17 TaxID=3240266 RepID=UPI003F99D614